MEEKKEPQPSGDTAQIEKAPAEILEENPELDRRVNRKFDLHIVPWLFGIWYVRTAFMRTPFSYIPDSQPHLIILVSRLFSFIDRSNIGNARLAGLERSLRMGPIDFNIALFVFYITYILVDIPSNLMLKKLKPGIYLPSLITAWGVVCLCTGFTKSFAGLVICRLLLGLFEGGILGGVMIYLAMFYRRHELLFRSGLFYCAAPLSGAFGGLLASGLAQISYGGYEYWPWIFISMIIFPGNSSVVVKYADKRDSRGRHDCRFRHHLLLLHARHAGTGQVSD